MLIFFLGIELNGNPRDFLLTQINYVKSLLCKTQIEDCKPAITPWAGDVIDRLSTGSHLIDLGPNLISWCSKKQSTSARSRTETKYKAIANVTNKFIWIKSHISQLHIPLQTVPTLSSGLLGLQSYFSRQSETYLSQLPFCS